MPWYGGYAPYPRRYGGGKPFMQLTLASLNANMGTAYDTTDTTSTVVAENMAAARGIAAVYESNARLANQWDPLRMTDFLPRWEKNYALTPSPEDTDTARRARVATVMARWGTSGLRSTIISALTATLGQNFVQLVDVPSSTATLGQVTLVTVTNRGSGYTSASVSFSGGGGTGATASVTIGSGQITSVSLTAVGSGYTSAPTVNLSGGGGSGAVITASINAAGQVQALVISSAGTGYTSAPGLSFSGGGGTGAAASASINGITGITVTSGGSGYLSAPTATITGSGGTGAAAKSLIADGIVAYAPGGTTIPTDTWSSTIAHLKVQVQRLASQTEAQFRDTIAGIGPTLDAILPAWVTWDWYTGSPFILDFRNLDEEIFGV